MIAQRRRVAERQARGERADMSSLLRDRSCVRSTSERACRMRGFSSLSRRACRSSAGLRVPAFWAWLLVSKFCDHLPLHRLEGIFARYNVPRTRSTLCGWVEATHDVCAPLVPEMWHDALKSDYIAFDATGVLVQAAERPGAATSGCSRRTTATCPFGTPSAPASDTWGSCWGLPRLPPGRRDGLRLPLLGRSLCGGRFFGRTTRGATHSHFSLVSRQRNA